MNDNEFKILWQSTTEKTDISTFFNQKITDDITKIKMKNYLSSMKPIKIFTVIAALLWIIPMGFLIGYLFIYSSGNVNLFFLFSAGLQVFITIISLGIYLYQLFLIYKIDFAGPVIHIQKSLSRLRISTLLSARVAFLQLPLWTTFYLSENMIKKENLLLLVIQGFVTLIFTYAAIWLFTEIKIENRNKKWFQWIFRGKEWQPILLSMDLIDQIKIYQDAEPEKSSSK